MNSPYSDKDLNKAQDVAFNNISKLLPAVNKTKGSNYFVSFNSNETENDIKFTTKISVPLYTLLGKKISISSSAYREKEKL